MRLFRRRVRRAAPVPAIVACLALIVAGCTSPTPRQAGSTGSNTLTLYTSVTQNTVDAP